MLAREYCDMTKRKLKPIIISHAMLPGLLEVSHKLNALCPQLSDTHMQQSTVPKSKPRCSQSKITSIGTIIKNMMSKHRIAYIPWWT